MRLWTIQTDDAYHRLIADGQLVADPTRCDPDFVGPYKWMLNQMRRRIKGGTPSSKAALWAWSKWEPPTRDRPDLRARGHLPPGQSGYRIELDVHADDVLLSDYCLWHHVLNYWYVPSCNRDQEIFESEHDQYRYGWERLPPPKMRVIITASWERIFNLDCCDEYVTGHPSNRPIQATMWRIHRSMICGAQHFNGR